MRTNGLPVGPSPQDWAHANITVSEYKTDSEAETIYELRKTLVINDVTHIQHVWLNKNQLRTIGINHGL